MSELENLYLRLDAAVGGGRLLASSAENIRRLLGGAGSPVYVAAVAELTARAAWQELNDRFFQTLAFGTGGLRGRTIGNMVAAVERGAGANKNCPDHPCVGTNAMNFFNVNRATRGLAAYVKHAAAGNSGVGRPKIVVAHDTRFFSRAFAELAAKILSDLGCDALLFEGPRSTPELSFAIRMTKAMAGINLTASHNPPSYNGYKVYFADGGQIVEPHATGIITEVNRIDTEDYTPLPDPERGHILPLGRAMDQAYLARLATLPVDSHAIAAATDLAVVYTPLHGTGSAIIPALLERLGVRFSVVGKQAAPDGSFPTVQSPNPEVPAALEMAMAQAESEGADLVVATDPDADRMGVAARNAAGRLELLSGNQVGSILAFHRLTKFFDAGILDESNRDRATIIKTFVTTDLQQSIAAAFGVRCVETLTGFKYIGAKLKKYEDAVPAALRRNYVSMCEQETRNLRLRHSTLFVFGGEESYGYSGADFVRDKDANAAVAMLCEAAAWAGKNGWTLHALLDRLFASHGIFLERGESISMEGAEGAEQIRRLVASYRSDPPTEMDGRLVADRKDFAEAGLLDAEGDPLPQEPMLMFSLDGGFRVAVRPSGTEPKIKFYLFGCEAPDSTEIAPGASLQRAKARVNRALDNLWQWIRADARRRLEDPI